MRLKNNLTVESQMQKYMNRGFYPRQLEQIRYGLEDNIDVSKYLSTRYNANVMRLLRELITFDEEFDIDDYAKDDKLELEQLFISHAMLALLSSDIEPFSDATRTHTLMWGPYYTVDKSERLK